MTMTLTYNHPQLSHSLCQYFSHDPYNQNHDVDINTEDKKNTEMLLQGKQKILLDQIGSTKLCKQWADQ